MSDEIDPVDTKKMNWTVAGLVIFFVSLACAALVLASGVGLLAAVVMLPGATATQTAPVSATLDPNCNDAACLRVCMSNLPNVIGPLDPGRPDPTEEYEMLHSQNPQGEYELVTYAVKGDEIKLTFAPGVPARLQKYQQDTDLHHRIWGFITTILPKSLREVLTTFTLKTAGSDTKITTFVHYFPPRYYLEVDIFDISDPYVFADALVQESGYLLTMNKNQISYEYLPVEITDLESYQAMQKKCGHLFFNSWCALPDSYINLFYERFWKGRHDDTLYALDDVIYNSRGDYLAIGRQLFKEHPDEFLTEFAAFDISQDIVVSFEYFVRAPKPEGNTMAEQKALFFYEFPELVKLREEIMRGICGYAAQQ